MFRPIACRRSFAHLVACGAALCLAAPSFAAETPVDFEKEIRPLLAAHCQACHGPTKQEGGLRLDARALAYGGGDSGPAFVAGKPEQSELISRIQEQDPKLRMPPKGAPLSAEQTAILARWVREGAVWPDDSELVKRAPDHWSFQPLVAPPLPPRPEANPIDKFIRVRLAKEGMQPSPPADRHTLLRRLSLDLTGLPPTAEEIAAFLGDRSPQAVDTVVERLLASPHFGERWAMPWLDLGRYADSDGYEKDNPRPNAYHWRDWLIGAINRDLPFDQFTIQQLAGDLLPDATPEMVRATGFHRNTLTNREGGVDGEEFRVAAVLDRTATTAAAWLGLTLGCAQCHSHKYDPVSQREFYSLFAFFNEANERDLVVDAEPAKIEAWQKSLAEHQTELARLQGLLDVERPRLEKELLAWAAERRAAAVGKWTAFEGIETLAEGPGVWKITARTRLPKLTGLRLQLAAPTKENGWTLAGVELAAQPAGGAAGPLQAARILGEGKAGAADLPDLLRGAAAWTPEATGKPTQNLTLVVGSGAVAEGWVGHPLADGSQDTGANFLNVHHQHAIAAPATIRKLKTHTKAVKDATWAVYLLRREAAGVRVVRQQTFTADGAAGVKEWTLAEPWKVQAGDLLAHSGSGGPTFTDGQGTPDAMHYPVDKLPKAGDLVPLETLPKIPARKYALQCPLETERPAAAFLKPEWTAEGATVTVRLKAGAGNLQVTAIEASQEANPLEVDPPNVPKDLIPLVKLDSASWTAEQKQKLFAHYLTLDERAKPLAKQLDDHKKKTPAKPTYTWHVMQQGGPRPTHVHVRGDFLKKGTPVQAGVPAFLPPLAPRGKQPDRLDLARWLVSAEHPLTPRVAVNQVWSQLFGQGLVRTPDDFGTQGEKPSHPELLDWLALEFRARGWRRKDLIRLIVSSETYRQASHQQADGRQRDPENRLLSRQNRFRLDAELVHDQYLAASGLLVRSIGGPSFRPAMPDGVARIAYANSWKADTGSDLLRRGLYIHLQRTLMLPMLSTFDRPEGVLTCARRDRSNTPLQALTLLNAPSFVDAARALAVALAADGSLDDAGRVQRLWLRTVSRPPTPDETARVLALVETLAADYAAQADAARKLAGDEKSWGAAVPAPRAAAWVAVCRAALNLDEVITRE